MRSRPTTSTIAVPVSFLAARNIMARNWFGTTVYTVVRGFLNIIRSFDSLVLAVIFALWVGFGAFAGMLALTVVTSRKHRPGTDRSCKRDRSQFNRSGAFCSHTADHTGFHLVYHISLGY